MFARGLYQECVEYRFLCATSESSVSLWLLFIATTYHRDTEVTEVTQKTAQRWHRDEYFRVTFAATTFARATSLKSPYSSGAQQRPFARWQAGYPAN